MVSLWQRAAVLLAVVSAVSEGSKEVGGAVQQVDMDMGGIVDKVGVDVGLMVGQIVKNHLSGCHLVLITATPHSLITSIILRRLSEGVEAGVVVDTMLLSQEQLVQDHLLQVLWGDAKTTCRGLILDLSDSNSTGIILRLLETYGLWQLPETRVVLVGGRTRVRDVLLHHSFRNTLHALYLATNDLNKLFETLRYGNSRLKKVDVMHEEDSSWLVYRRCLYCYNGEPDVQLVHQKSLTFPGQANNVLFQDQLQDFSGHKFRVGTVAYFPYIDYKMDSNEPGSRVTLKDSLDTRLLSTFSTKLNFTYDIREDPERSWGVWNNGVFNGMIGHLQREEIDFCTESAPTPERLMTVEYARGYPSDLMVVASLKPTLLPQYLSFVRPFTGELWVALLVSVVVWSVIMWLLLRAWQWVVSGREVKFKTVIMFGWGVLLGQPPPDPSTNVSGQVLVGWWLLFSLVVTTGYSSSLVAHLTVQGTSPPLETLQDILKQHNWKWGTESSLYKGAVIEYFSKHTDPVVKEINQKMEVLDTEKALKKVLVGHYSLIVFRSYVSVIVASRFTDARGHTPFFISNKGIYVLANLGWCFRKGAPFYSRFSKLMLRLEAAGITSYWTEDVIARRVKDNREAAALDPQFDLEHTSSDETREVVLGLNHLQGAFYVLLLGVAVAFLTLQAEILAQWRSIPQQRQTSG